MNTLSIEHIYKKPVSPKFKNRSGMPTNMLSRLQGSVETGSGHPGHIFSGSSGSDPVYNLSGSDPDWIT